MKKTVIGIVSIAATLSLLLSACGASSKDNNTAASSPAVAVDYGYYDEAAPAEMAEVKSMAFDMSAVEQEMGQVQENRKEIRHSYLSLESKEFDKAFEQIKTTIAEQGGYIESQNVDGKSINYRGDYYERSASMVARIPAQKLDSTVTTVGEICNVVSQSESIEDITDTYFDTQAHLDTLQLQEERLLAILEKADKLEDVITLEKALSDVRYEIEALTAQMKRMDSQVAYSYLNIDLREVVEYQQMSTAPKTFGEKLSAAASRGWSHIVSSVQGILLAIVEIGPVLLIWAAVIVIILLIVWKAHKSRRRKKEEKASQQAADTGDKKNQTIDE